jgi:hypothetical protein
MGNVKESMGGAGSKPSNQQESQGSIISKRVVQPQYLEETAENDLVNIGPELLNYGQQNLKRYEMTTLNEKFDGATTLQDVVLKSDGTRARRAGKTLNVYRPIGCPKSSIGCP